MNNLCRVFRHQIGLALLLFGGISSAWGAATVTGINQVSATRVGRTTYNFTYTVNVTNGAGALSNAVATVTSSGAGTTIIQGAVALGTLASNASITSTNTFTLQQDRTVAFDPASLIWNVSGTAVDLVPNVVGLAQAAASSAISSAGLTLGTVTQQSSTTVASGNVISESPIAGTQVNAGSAVNLIVSSGLAKVAVPNVVGIAQAAASSAISSAGLTLGTVTQQSSTTVASGNVISESPTAGTQVNAGSAVNLVVSLGPAQAAVPNVVGLTQAAASSAIAGAGLAVGTITQQASSAVASGDVISESPTAGTQVNAGSAVNLVVSSGPANVAVPNVVGLSQAAASSAITGAGLILGTVTTVSSATVPSGSVISQSPGGGTSVAPGSAVNLSVSTGPPPVTVPNVVGLTQAAASSAITGAGLAVGTITTASSSSVPSGSVISQSPAGGAGVANGTAVNLVVSSGPASSAVLLPGNGGAAAIGATYNIAPVAANLSYIVNQVILNEISVYFSPQATVAQVNAAISAVSGSISAMESGVPEFTIQVPLTQSVDALAALAAQIQAMPGILLAVPATTAQAKVWPTDATTAAEANLQHLAGSRALAAASVARQLAQPCSCVGGACPTLIIQDEFSDAGLGQPADYVARTPGVPTPASCYAAGAPAPAMCPTNHGNHVLMVATASYVANNDANNVMLGASPFAGCVNVIPLQTEGINVLDEQKQLSTALRSYFAANPTSSVIVSSSQGYTDGCGSTLAACKALSSAQLAALIPTPYNRALDALSWRTRMQELTSGGDSFANRTMIAVAAGNEANKVSATSVYPGAGAAVADWWLTLAPTATPLATFAVDGTLWDAVSSGFSDVTASASEVANLNSLESTPLGKAYSGNTLIVGALNEPLGFTNSPPQTGPFPKLDNWLSTQTPAAFSDVFRPGDPSMFAVGTDVLVECPPTTGCSSPLYQDGTSFATPQVSGLAALLWSIDSRVASGLGVTALDQSPASATVNVITATATSGPTGANGKSIDALAAVLSLDTPAAVTPATAPVRLALVDFNADGVFNAADVQDFVAHYYVGGAGGPARTIAPNPVLGTPIPQPDFQKYDLNGDGYTGLYTTTTFDLDPTGSTQRGAPVLNTISETLPDGRSLHFNEAAVTDLDVICYYAYSALFDATSDPDGSIRNTLRCPSVTILSETGDTLFGGSDSAGVTQTISAIDSKAAVNKAGGIALAVTNTNGGSAGAYVTVPHSANPITFIGAANRSFGGATVNDAAPIPQAAFRETVSGAPPSFFVRRWNTDGSTVETDVGVSSKGNIFASASFFQDINDSGVVVFPALDPDSINQLLLAGNGTTNFLGTPQLQTIGTFADTASVLLRPQIASTNQIVYRDATGSVVVALATPANTSSSPATVTVGPGTVLSNVSDRPGISADGNWVAFGATLTGLNPGLLVGQAAVAGSGQYLLSTGVGGDPTTANAMFNSFGTRPSGGRDQPRFGIAARVIPTGTDITVVFAAQRSYLDPVTKAVTRTVYGVYRLSALATVTGATATYQVNHVDPIVEVGDKIPDMQGGMNVTRTVADFDLWDPISKDGLYGGFWVQFLETGVGGTPIQAVVRARL